MKWWERSEEADLEELEEDDRYDDDFDDDRQVQMNRIALFVGIFLTGIGLGYVWAFQACGG